MMQALKAFITVPQSSLLSYTATDVGPTSDVTRNVGHKSISYKVHAGPALSYSTFCMSAFQPSGHMSGSEPQALHSLTTSCCAAMGLQQWHR